MSSVIKHINDLLLYGIDPYTFIYTILSTPQNLLQSTMNLGKNAQNINLSSGSVTCHENTIENANCPKDQYMEVKSA